MTIGGATITQDPSSNFVIGSQTLVPGELITHPGTVLSLAPSGGGVVFGPSTQAIQLPPSPQPLPVVTVAGSTLTANAASQFEIGTQALVPGAAPITQDGQVISLAPSASTIVLGPNTQQIASPAGAPAPAITVGSFAVTQNPAGQFVIGSQTLAAGSPPITVSGQAVSMAPSGNAVMFVPTTQTLAPAAPPMPVITIAGQAVTANFQNQFVINSQTLGPNSPPITVAGQLVFHTPSANIIILGPSTEALAIPALATAATIPPILTIGPSLLTADASSNYIIDGQALIPDALAITISGTPISLAPSATALVVGSSTENLSPALLRLTTALLVPSLGTACITADTATAYIIDAETLHPGFAITVSGATAATSSISLGFLTKSLPSAGVVAILTSPPKKGEAAKFPMPLLDVYVTVTGIGMVMLVL